LPLFAAADKGTERLVLTAIPRSSRILIWRTLMLVLFFLERSGGAMMTKGVENFGETAH
jgi:hypothetical protein